MSLSCKQGRTLFRPTWGILLLVLLVGTAQAQSLPDFTELAATAGPAVVNISTRQASESPLRGLPKQIPLPEFPEGSPWEDLFRHFFGERGDSAPEAFESRSLGSGFVIDGEGHILTNNHVVAGAEEIVVRFSDRRELKAELVGADPRSDIALLKVDAGDLPVVPLGRSGNLKVGEWVMAIGSPFGFDHSVSVGVISALGRALPSENYVPFIQTDVAINPGNSGGPLFNLDGQVVGINSQIYSRTGGYMGVSFAIPIDVAMEVVAQIKKQGYVSRGWLGVLIQDVNRDLAESFGMEKPMGALVARVLENGPAAAAGIQVGDVIVEFAGKPVHASSDLPHLVGRTTAGSDAKVKVIREGKTRTLTVRIGELPAEEELAIAADGGDRTSDNRLGLTVEPLPVEAREKGERGVVVREVRSGPAEKAGVRRGDVILRINGVEVTGLDQFREVARKLPAGKSVPVLVQRQGSPMFLALRVPE